MKAGDFISYYRVSTRRQGESGLGLDAQKKSVEDYLNGGDWRLIAEYVEVESGKRDNRPEMEKALAHAKASGATLILAKMDRLGRRAGTVLKMLDDYGKAGVKFVFVEMPHASKLEIGIRAVVAEEEGRMISERTKAALAAAKRRGVKLGKHGAELARQNKQAAQQRATDLAPTIAEIRAGGAKTVRGICDELNNRGIPAPRGGHWFIPSAFRLLKLIDGKRRKPRGKRPRRK
jgi:DNA invertase Pin-like site-specific DNA recombinase